MLKSMVFEGIPYSRSVAGSARFQPSAACETRVTPPGSHPPGPAAPQRPSRLEGVMGKLSAPQAEDCLTLNIWTPDCNPAKRPVVVWFHGGAYISGAGNMPCYHGRELSERGDKL